MKYLLFSTLLFCNISFAQNLIPNGDFELGPDSSSGGWILGYPWDTTNNACVAATLLNGPDFWAIVTPSPDRMVEDYMPMCNWDSDTAQSGKAYCVFGSGNNHFSEAGKSTLLFAMQNDTFYLLNYCVSLQTFMGYGTSPAQIAIIFNDEGDSINSPLITSTFWQCYDTIFTSSANSTEITIKGVYPIGSAGANVDNISLTKISSTGINALDDDNNNIVLFPNPATEILNIKSNAKILSVEISDLAGKKLVTNNKSSINVASLSSGVYLVRVKTIYKSSIKKILIK